MTEFRCDRGAILIPPKPELTPEGFLRTYLRIARVGELTYRNVKDGSERIEVVTPEVLFNKDSMNSFKMKPITLLHPPVKVTSENIDRYQKGMLGHYAIPDGDFLGFTATVTSKQAIDAILSKDACEASCGYDAATALRGDGKLNQVSRIGNHLSIVPRGRGGSDVKFCIDGFNTDGDEPAFHTNLWYQVDGLGDDTIAVSDVAQEVLRDLKVQTYFDLKPSPGKLPMKRFKLDGFEFETEDIDLAKHAKSVDAELTKLRSDADSAAKLRADSESAHSAVSAKLAEAQTKLDAAETANEALKSEKSEIQGKLDAAETKANELQAKLDAAPKQEERTDAAEIASAVSSRLNLWTEVLPYLRSDSADYQPDYNLDDTAIRKLYLSKRRSDMNFDGKDATYINAFYEALKPEPQKDTASNVDGFLAGLNAYRASNEDAMSYEEKKKAAREAQRKAIENGGRK